MLSCSYAQPPPQKPEVPSPRFPEQKRKQIDMLSWAPEILLQLEKICDAFSAATHRIPFPKLSECSISSMHPEQQNSFLSVNGKESKTEITTNQIMVWGFFFLQEKSAFEQYSLDRGPADHCGSTLTLLMQKGLVCLMYLSKPPWIPWVRSWLHLQDPGLAVNRALGIFSF